jgi:Fe-S cluster assembly protein SufD
MSEEIDRPIADFRRIADSLPGRHKWLQALREDALRRFSETGYPTPRDEAWKYTNLTPFLLGKSFAPAIGGGEAAMAGLLDDFLFPDSAAPVLVFVDGFHVPGLSRTAGLPSGVMVASLGDVLRGTDDRDIETFLTGHVPVEPRGFAQLNTAFMTDGACIRIPAGVAIERPIHLLYIVRPGAQPFAAYWRNLIAAAPGSRATVVEHYVSVDGAQALTSAVTQCVLADGAAVEHYQLNEQGDGVYHFAGIHVHQTGASRYASHNVQAGARLARGDVHAVLAGQGSECTLNGLYLGRGRQHIDNYTYIDHQVPRCTSRESYKGVLDDQSRGIFNGQIIVRQDAQRTDARQVNHNLLLSEDAEADTRPQLLIYADDVQCSHGSTVGQLDRDALFYLRARGLDEAQARRMLVTAFAQDVVDRMSVEAVRRRLERLVAERLSH